MLNFTILLLQIAIIITTAHVAGRLARPLRQPAIIGEMIAGLLLGPTLFGWLWPEVHAWIFPAASLPPLNAISQVGLVLFMFVVGVQVDPEHLRKARRVSVVVSGASVIVPFVLGGVLGAAVHGRLAPPGVLILPFALFIGVAMSITAFPVLARILTDCGLLRTPVGTLAITCAAVNDVTGWLLLAVVTAIARVDSGSLALQGALFAVYVATMVRVVRPILRWRVRTRGGRFGASAEDLAFVLPTVLLSAAATEALGMHALFGAFFAGVVMPREANLERSLAERVEPIARILFLPIFFALTGLRTSVRLIEGAAWWDAALILAVAVVGKGAGSTLSARAMGLSWQNAAALGALMNTRGLIELVILNIGMDLGILSPVTFSMMVLMALVTTFMTSPLLLSLVPDRRRDLRLTVGT
jgi:Kef-type K+ transport system membrane component KefB